MRNKRRKRDQWKAVWSVVWPILLAQGVRVLLELAILWSTGAQTLDPLPTLLLI